MTTTIPDHGFVADDAHGRDRHDVRLAGPMALSVETWFFHHADAVRSCDPGPPGQIRLDVFDPPTGWIDRSDVRDILLRARLEHSRAGGTIYVDRRSGSDPHAGISDLGRV